jgi:hypothetical protein
MWSNFPLKNTYTKTRMPDHNDAPTNTPGINAKDVEIELESLLNPSPVNITTKFNIDL